MNLYFFSAVLGFSAAFPSWQRGVDAFLPPQAALGKSLAGQRSVDPIALSVGPGYKAAKVSSSEAILARPHGSELGLALVAGVPHPALVHPNAQQTVHEQHKKHHQQSMFVHANEERASEDHRAKKSTRKIESVKGESQAEGMKLVTDFNLLSSCASNGEVISSIPVVQFTENANDLSNSSLGNLLHHMAPLVDMAYVLCMHCPSLKFFKGVENIRLVSGSASDKCSGLQDHHQRIGFAHKAAVADAQMNGYSRILIAEEDSTINQLPDLVEFEKQVEMHWTENSHQLIRLTALPPAAGRWPLAPGSEVFDESGSCKMDNCKCSIGRDKMFCTLKQGCPQIHDSSLYMIAQPAYAAFMDNDSIIDTDLFASFDSLLMTTPIAFQDHQLEDKNQAQAWDLYRNACIE